MTVAARRLADAKLRVERAYEGVANVFQNMARKAAADFKPAQSSAFRVSIVGPGRLRAKCLTKIERLPYRRAADGGAVAKQRLTVVLEADEEFAVDCGTAEGTLCLNRSTVQIAYYRPGPGTLTTLLCVRYDFHGAGDSHPIFHAQIDKEAIDATKLHLLGLHTGPSPMAGDIPHRVRIPTANVIGPTALVQLAADHLPQDSFRTVLNKVRGDVLFTRWLCDRSSLDRPSELRKLISSTWYGLPALAAH